ncbi:MAG TPA: threonine ammonia-lyase [Romboutsia timonensis]|uniref:threonine ammonia-lyase n=1 Tax=Romboutsia timonensis TaxID=1776391 RepID=A0A921N0T7_9FIRM|nr:threonine ammonia-lyase [uncultured Romboutsia sp.]HJG96888.1 threonine ammonia-lyase [Romboutsia timonensis]
MTKVTLQDIKDAKETIKDIVKKTDILESAKLSAMTGANVFYKCENLQKTGSFKVRGACNKIANLTDEEKANGVIASSAGNHAQGVALGAKMTGIKATIVMPATAPLAKVTATKGYGAEVVLNGLVYDDAYAKAVELQKETGATFLHPFDDKYVIAGQGTIGLEILEQLDGNVDTIVCPIGGGGIIAGIAVAAKGINPNIKIVGVQTANIPSMQESMKNGEVTTAFKATTIADGIAVKTPGNVTFEIIKELVDEVIVVEEDEIAQGMLFLMENQKVVAEGSGAVSTAALLSGKYVPQKDENVVCVISGGNVDVNTLYRVIGTALTKEGRRYAFNTVIQDKPGGLAELTKIISEHDANILNVNLSRSSMGGGLGRLTTEMVLETFNQEHIDKLKAAITKAGFEIIEI